MATTVRKCEGFVQFAAEASDSEGGGMARAYQSQEPNDVAITTARRERDNSHSKEQQVAAAGLHNDVAQGVIQNQGVLA